MKGKKNSGSGAGGTGAGRSCAGRSLPKYDVRSVFERIPELTGMDLTRKGDQWQGGYYMNGDTHAWRRDKLKVYKFKEGIWLTEEGGDTISLTTWLQQYGGASDYWDAIHILKGCRTPIFAEHIIEQKKEVLYVGKDALEAAKGWDLNNCPLFRWMCVLFNEAEVRKAWDLYNVTTDSRGLAVFWFVDGNGKICHDKRVRYLSNGHRDKAFGGTREYTTMKGYSGRCMFGAHLVDGDSEVRVVESEKSAILAYLYTGKVFLASGGKNALREVDDKMILYPDMDAIGEWQAKGANICEWWAGADGLGEHADYGDLIERNRRVGE